MLGAVDGCDSSLASFAGAGGLLALIPSGSDRSLRPCPGGRMITLQRAQGGRLVASAIPSGCPRVSFSSITWDLRQPGRHAEVLRLGRAGRRRGALPALSSRPR